MVFLLLSSRLFLLARSLLSHRLFSKHFRHICSAFEYSRKFLQAQVSNRVTSSTTGEEGRRICSFSYWAEETTAKCPFYSLFWVLQWLDLTFWELCLHVPGKGREANGNVRETFADEIPQESDKLFSSPVFREPMRSLHSSRESFSFHYREKLLPMCIWIWMTPARLTNKRFKEVLERQDIFSYFYKIHSF